MEELSSDSKSAKAIAEAWEFLQLAIQNAQKKPDGNGQYNFLPVLYAVENLRVACKGNLSKIDSLPPLDEKFEKFLKAAPNENFYIQLFQAIKGMEEKRKHFVDLHSWADRVLTKIVGSDDNKAFLVVLGHRALPNTDAAKQYKKSRKEFNGLLKEKITQGWKAPTWGAFWEKYNLDPKLTDAAMRKVFESLGVFITGDLLEVISAASQHTEPGMSFQLAFMQGIEAAKKAETIAVMGRTTKETLAQTPAITPVQFTGNEITAISGTSREIYTAFGLGFLIGPEKNPGDNLEAITKDIHRIPFLSQHSGDFEKFVKQWIDFNESSYGQGDARGSALAAIKSVSVLINSGKSEEDIGRIKEATVDSAFGYLDESVDSDRKPSATNGKPSGISCYVAHDPRDPSFHYWIITIMHNSTGSPDKRQMHVITNFPRSIEPIFQAGNLKTQTIENRGELLGFLKENVHSAPVYSLLEHSLNKDCTFKKEDKQEEFFTQKTLHELGYSQSPEEDLIIRSKEGVGAYGPTEAIAEAKEKLKVLRGKPAEVKATGVINSNFEVVEQPKPSDKTVKSEFTAEQLQRYVQDYEGVRNAFVKEGYWKSLEKLAELFEKIKTNFLANTGDEPEADDLIKIIHHVMEKSGLKYIDFVMIEEYKKHNEVWVHQYGSNATSLEIALHTLKNEDVKRVVAASVNNKSALFEYLDQQKDGAYKLFFLEEMFREFTDPKEVKMLQHKYVSILRGLGQDPLIVPLMHQRLLAQFAEEKNAVKKVPMYAIQIRKIPMERVVDFIKLNPQHAKALFDDIYFKFKFANIDKQDHLSEMIRGRADLRNAIRESAVMNTRWGEKVETLLTNEFKKAITSIATSKTHQQLLKLFDSPEFMKELLNNITAKNIKWLPYILIETSTPEFRKALSDSKQLDNLPDDNISKEPLKLALSQKMAEDPSVVSIFQPKPQLSGSELEDDAFDILAYETPPASDSDSDDSEGVFVRGPGMEEYVAPPKGNRALEALRTLGLEAVDSERNVVDLLIGQKEINDIRKDCQLYKDAVLEYNAGGIPNENFELQARSFRAELQIEISEYIDSLREIKPTDKALEEKIKENIRELIALSDDLADSTYEIKTSEEYVWREILEALKTADVTADYLPVILWVEKLKGIVDPNGRFSEYDISDVVEKLASQLNMESDEIGQAFCYNMSNVLSGMRNLDGVYPAINRWLEAVLYATTPFKEKVNDVPRFEEDGQNNPNAAVAQRYQKLNELLRSSERQSAQLLKTFPLYDLVSYMHVYPERAGELLNNKHVIARFIEEPNAINALAQNRADLRNLIRNSGLGKGEKNLKVVGPILDALDTEIISIAQPAKSAENILETGRLEEVAVVSKYPLALVNLLNSNKDPFTVSMRNSIFKVSAAYKTVGSTTINDIVDMILAHPEFAVAFLKRRIGTKLPWRGRNFRQEICSDPDLLGALISSDSTIIRDAILQERLLDSSHIPEKQRAKFKSSFNTYNSIIPGLVTEIEKEGLFAFEINKIMKNPELAEVKFSDKDFLKLLAEYPDYIEEVLLKPELHAQVIKKDLLGQVIKIYENEVSAAQELMVANPKKVNEFRIKERMLQKIVNKFGELNLMLGHEQQQLDRAILIRIGQTPPAQKTEDENRREKAVEARAEIPEASKPVVKRDEFDDFLENMIKDLDRVVQAKPGSLGSDIRESEVEKCRRELVKIKNEQIKNLIVEIFDKKVEDPSIELPSEDQTKAFVEMMADVKNYKQFKQVLVKDVVQPLFTRLFNNISETEFNNSTLKQKEEADDTSEETSANKSVAVPKDRSPGPSSHGPGAGPH